MANDITISVVSHGQDRLLAGLLDDLSATTLNKSCAVRSILITHNLGSPELDCSKSIVERFHVIINARPKGFGANHNSAFARCDTDWFAVLNPDIRFGADVFDRLIEHARPEDGVLAPSLVEPASGALAPRRGLLTPWEIFRRRLPNWQPPTHTVWFPGAFLLIRSAAFRQIGGFDERYHLYVEDFDLCARLRLAGWKLHDVPEVHVEHSAQRSSHVDWRYLRWHVASLLKLWTSSAFWRYRALLRKESRARTAQRPR
jgi:GT2 family glycosyltransferase